MRQSPRQRYPYFPGDFDPLLEPLPSQHGSQTATASSANPSPGPGFALFAALARLTDLLESTTGRSDSTDAPGQRQPPSGRPFADPSAAASEPEIARRTAALWGESAAPTVAPSPEHAALLHFVQSSRSQQRRILNSDGLPITIPEQFRRYVWNHNTRAFLQLGGDPAALASIHTPNFVPSVSDIAWLSRQVFQLRLAQKLGESLPLHHPMPGAAASWYAREPRWIGRRERDLGGLYIGRSLHMRIHPRWEREVLAYAGKNQKATKEEMYQYALRMIQQYGLDAW
jgi:hypothetical protein